MLAQGECGESDGEVGGRAYCGYVVDVLGFVGCEGIGAGELDLCLLVCVRVWVLSCCDAVREWQTY